MGAAATSPRTPPAFLHLAAHPVRWSLLVELSASDRSVQQLCSATGCEQSLVSYHLAQLRRAGLTTARRSSADGRDRYYRLDLRRCRALLSAAGEAIHPGFADRVSPQAPVEPTRVLFLCTGNSGRSQMAEAMLRSRAGGAVVVASAGSRPKPVHPDAVAVLAARGVDLSGQRSKHLDELIAQRWDVVVTLCDRVREECPELPIRTRRIHWSTPDPSAAGSASATRAAFEDLVDDLDERIDSLLPLLGQDASAPRPERRTMTEDITSVRYTVG